MEGKINNLYQFNHKPLFVHCKELFNNPLDSDVTFVSKQKDEIKAHKLILITASSFFKNIFTSELESYKILLPNYSTQSISAFVQFFYNSGEIFINESLMKEFVELCQEFNCEEIPVISDLIKNQKECEEVPISREVLIKKESSSSSTVCTSEKVVMFDEYFETHENVETIFFNENEGEFLHRSTEPSKREKEEHNQEEAVEVKEEYLNIQYIVESPSFMIVDSEKPYTEDAEQQEAEEVTSLRCKLESVVDKEKKSPNYHEETDKKHGISRSMIYKQVKPSEPLKQPAQKPIVKVKSTAAPSITFPALAMNLTQLREEQNRFKKRLQEAINSCRDSGNSVKKAAKKFGVPEQSIERNLQGFKNTN